MGNYLTLLAQSSESPIEGSEELEESVDEVEEGAFALWESALDALPRIGIALTFILAGWLCSRALRAALRGFLSRRHPPSFTEVMSKVGGWLFLACVVLAATAVTFPSVKPVDLLAGLGFFSVAAGFAFQDILENTLAGILLLFRQPFSSDDQIEVEGVRGTVEAISIRETQITTFDGRQVIIPNADVYKNMIIVQTKHEATQVDFVVGISYEADVDRSLVAVRRALESVDGVVDDPGPDAVIDELGASAVMLVARFWTDPRQRNLIETKSAAIASVKRALDAAEIDLPSQIIELEATPSFASALHGRDVDSRD